MGLLIASEAHFRLAPGGVWAEGPESYEFWEPYREFFPEVRVLARVGLAPEPAPGWARSEGPGVRFDGLPDYRGPWGYLASLGALRARVERAVQGADALLLRAPGAIAYLAFGAARRLGLDAYAVEVLGDPFDSLAGESLVVAPAARRWSRRRLGELCRRAPLVSYVTRRQLQQGYPPGGESFWCSDARLGAPAPAAVRARRRERLWQAVGRERPFELGMLGSLDRLYKAPEVHLAAVARCRRRGIHLRFSIAGEGRQRPGLERLARQLGISDIVRFPGRLAPGAAVESFLDSLDLFLQASRTEGLPRSLVEAMNRGLPAIGSTAGGIPELLKPEWLVEPGSAAALGALIERALSDPQNLERASALNLETAAQYNPRRLAGRRRSFLGALRDLAEREVARRVAA